MNPTRHPTSNSEFALFTLFWFLVGVTAALTAFALVRWAWL